jgi:flavodoxin I
MKILILFGTLTGNTQAAAMMLLDSIKAQSENNVFEIKDLRHMPLEDIKHYDGVIFGTSTWDEGNANPDTELFLEKLDTTHLDLSHVRFYLFCLGESFYEHFCAAVDKVRAKLTTHSAIVSSNSFTIDGEPTQEIINHLTQESLAFIKTIESKSY